MGRRPAPWEERSSLVDELWLFGSISGPTVALSAFNMLQWTYSSHVVGSMFGTEALSGVALANLSGNLTGLSIVMGFLTATETLMPQAFARGEFEKVGRIFFRGIVWCMALISLLVPFWLRIDQVLIFVQQPEGAARLAQRFLSLYMLSFPGVIIVESTLRLFRSQNIVAPLMLISGFVLVLHPIYVRFFTSVLGLGFDGIPLAHCATTYTNVVLCIILTKHLRYHHPLTFPRNFLSAAYLRKTFAWSKIWLLARLGLPGVLSMSEWWFWEAVCFMSGLFGENSLAAHSIVYAIIPLCFMIPLGFSVAITVRVGALLAEGPSRVQFAKRLARLAVVACMSVVLFNLLLVLALRPLIVSLFTNDPQVEALCEAIWFPWVGIFIGMDGLMGALSGVVRALALQARMGVAVFASLWLFGLPLMWLNAKVWGKGLLGIWQLMGVAYVALNMALYYCIATLDWTGYSLSISTTNEIECVQQVNQDGFGQTVASNWDDEEEDVRARLTQGPHAAKDEKRKQLAQLGKDSDAQEIDGAEKQLFSP